MFIRRLYAATIPRGTARARVIYGRPHGITSNRVAIDESASAIGTAERPQHRDIGQRQQHPDMEMGADSAHPSPRHAVSHLRAGRCPPIAPQQPGDLSGAELDALAVHMPELRQLCRNLAQ